MRKLIVPLAITIMVCIAGCGGNEKGKPAPATDTITTTIVDTPVVDTPSQPPPTEQTPRPRGN